MGMGGRVKSMAPKHTRPKTMPKYAQDTLPEGWEAAVDESSGDTYYYHEETGVTQWEAPESDKRLSVPRQLSTQEGDTEYVQ